MQWTGVIRVSSLIEKDIWRFLSIVFDLERTNQLILLPDKDLVNLCPPIAPYQVTKNRSFHQNEVWARSLNPLLVKLVDILVT